MWDKAKIRIFFGSNLVWGNGSSEIAVESQGIHDELGGENARAA